MAVAVISMLVAGMFEYNFGDSEFLMLFLGLITLPHAARLAPAGTEQTSGEAMDGASRRAVVSSPAGQPARTK